MDQKVIDAIKDAMEFLDVVPDDRDNAYIGWKRQAEVVKILGEFLKSQQHAVRQIEIDGE